MTLVNLSFIGLSHNPNSFLSNCELLPQHSPRGANKKHRINTK